jgi:hypothetical protein
VPCGALRGRWWYGGADGAVWCGSRHGAHVAVVWHRAAWWRVVAVQQGVVHDCTWWRCGGAQGSVVACGYSVARGSTWLRMVAVRQGTGRHVVAHSGSAAGLVGCWVGPCKVVVWCGVAQGGGVAVEASGGG